VSLGALINGMSLFVMNVLLGRFLSQEFFGIFSLSVLTLGTVAEISDLGLNAGLLRFVPYYLAQTELQKLNQLLKTVMKKGLTYRFLTFYRESIYV
jgi:O-antigen/teichoic acid export membrane protein